MPAKRPSYREAVRWIADNDEPLETDLETIAEMISVQLIADLFGKDPEGVAVAVAIERRQKPDVNAVIRTRLRERAARRREAVAAAARRTRT